MFMGIHRRLQDTQLSTVSVLFNEIRAHLCKLFPKFPPNSIKIFSRTCALSIF